MATSNGTIEMVAVCAGGDHVTIVTTIGAQTFSSVFHVDELRNAFTEDEIRDTTAVMTRFHCRGMTKAQAKVELQSPGISVVTSS